MNTELIFIVVAIVVLIAFFYSLYVKIIKNKNNLLEAKSGIDVQFKKRYDLIPNILKIAQKFMQHETEVFAQITNLRSQAMNAPKGSNESLKLNSQMEALISKLMVSVENYPELKSDSTMIQAMMTYNEVEEHIAAARRFYNSSLTELRNSAMIFPSSIFKGLVADVLDSEYYKANDDSKNSINISEYLK